MNRKLNIAVAGATGAVGEAMLSILAEYGYKGANVHALASAKSLGKSVTFGNRTLAVEVLEDFDFNGIDFALFSAGASVSIEHAPRAAKAGCMVIDNTSAFRRDEDIPLVVPEINGDLLENLPAGSIISNPNCSTIQMLIAIAPIHAIANTAHGALAGGGNDSCIACHGASTEHKQKAARVAPDVSRRGRIRSTVRQACVGH